MQPDRDRTGDDRSHLRSPPRRRCASASSPTPSTTRAGSAATSARCSPRAVGATDVELVVAAPAARRRARSTDLAGARLARTIVSRRATTRSASRSGTGTAPGRAFAAAGADGRDRLQAPRAPDARCPTVLVVHDVLTITRARENSPRQAPAAPGAVPAIAHRRDPPGRGERGDPDPARRARPRAGPRSATSCPNGMSTNLTTVDRGRARRDSTDRGVRARGRRPLAPQEPRRAHRAVARSAGRPPARGRRTRLRHRRRACGARCSTSSAPDARSGSAARTTPCCAGATSTRASCSSRPARRASVSRCSRR